MDLSELRLCTDPERVRGCIAYIDSKSVGPNQFKMGLSQDVRESGAVGAVYVVPGPSGLIVAQNAVPPYTQQPLPFPAVIAASEDEPILARAAAERANVALQIEGTIVPNVEARNVMGRLKRGPRWIVVSTPMSGWFECAGERGPGVALWLAIAEWAAEHDSDTSFFFIANSGHELDNMGAHRFTESDVAPKPDQVVCWLHLGASIATRIWVKTEDGWEPTAQRNPGNLVGSPEFVPILETAFKAVPELKPRSGESKGELAVVLAEGYRAFGFYGGHQWFHTARDVPASTSPEFLEPVARGCIAALEAIERTGQ